MKRTLLLLILSVYLGKAQIVIDNPIVLAYFPSWSESYAESNQDSKFRQIPNFVNYVFLAFAKPDMIYEKDSFDIGKTGLEVPYDGCTLKESVAALKKKNIKVILSVGGETYWASDSIYENIKYQQIKDLVDDIGFAGIDWDFEPNGSFANIGSAENVKHFQDFFTKSRELMPRNEGYILACAPSGVGALGGQFHDDPDSPFAYKKRNEVTGEDDTNLYNGTMVTNGINLFGFGATGHMIPVIKAVGDKIDIIAYQGYNAGGSQNRKVMYDAYAHYGKTYGFNVVAGIHYPNEPWGPYYEFTHDNVADLANHIKTHPDRIGGKDGIMIWQLLLSGTDSSAYSYMNVASKVLNGEAESNAIADANNFELQPYEGGAEGCNGIVSTEQYCGYSPYNNALSYPNPGTKVYANCAIWQNKWWANPNESPNSNPVWEKVDYCTEPAECSLSIDDISIDETIVIYQDEVAIYIKGEFDKIKIFGLNGQEILQTTCNEIKKSDLTSGIYILKISNKMDIRTEKIIVK